MTAKHTPGPWLIQEPGLVTYKPEVVVAGHDPVVAIVRATFSQTIFDANTRLIAAAPDLLEACKWTATRCADCDGQGRMYFESEPNGCMSCEPVRDAIAKAEGDPECPKP